MAWFKCASVQLLSDLKIQAHLPVLPGKKMGGQIRIGRAGGRHMIRPGFSDFTEVP